MNGWITKLAIFFRIFGNRNVEKMAYDIKGVVIRGMALGRKLGFPTANIRIGDADCPEDGIYAVRVRFAGREYEGMANLGRRPSIAHTDGNRLLEVNLFGFDGDLYGQEIEVSLVRYIRPEKRFDTLAELRNAVEQDRHAIEEFFRTC